MYKTRRIQQHLGRTTTMIISQHAGAHITRLVGAQIAEFVFRVVCVVWCYVTYPKHDLLYRRGGPLHCATITPESSLIAECAVSGCIAVLFVICDNKSTQYRWYIWHRIVNAVLFVAIPYCFGKFLIYMACVLELRSGMCYKHIYSMHLKYYVLTCHIFKTLFYLYMTLLIAHSASRFNSSEPRTKSVLKRGR